MLNLALGRPLTSGEEHSSSGAAGGPEASWQDLDHKDHYNSSTEYCLTGGCLYRWDFLL